MHYFIFPDIDTTIYQASASLNTGLDEILEVRKDLTDSNTNPKVSRILMKFDLSYISQSVSNGTIGNNAKYSEFFRGRFSQFLNILAFL